MELAAQISARRLKQKIGRTMQVLIDRIEGMSPIARSSSDAPEIDGTVRIEGGRGKPTGFSVGSLVNVQITAASDYDLTARLAD